ncbi:MAG: bifunctional methylenetetrahydrofolate dehydrogenase/methenyltetrahydrofolate cyclohydrolase FolD [Deltaproteobacteria bacterium]|nr:bifunctional methylenetetrahydrofolate dehydrogenase/methenyltetrahydrofolate cyclohydrolase FolD [Deltaproteobacteria bacterium]
MAELIDGKALAKEVRAEVRARAEAFRATHNRAPGLHVVLVGEDPASQVYVRNKERAAAKAGIDGRVHRLPAETSEADLLALIFELNGDDHIDGILVHIVDAIDPAKDVDGLHPFNAGLLVVGRKGLRPCTPSGCMKMLEHIGCDPKGKRALVLGRSTLVGKPIALMLLEKHATVTIAHSRTEDLADRVRESDILIAAVGRTNLVKGDWVKEGAVVIDVGINRLDDGKLTGDVDFEGAKERAAHITPVPGGVGPMTIAMLLSNTVDAAEARIL